MSNIALDPAAVPADQIGHLMNSLVVPRPIGWVSTVSASGVTNIAPHSYFNILSSNPPYVYFSSGGEKDTVRNVRFSRDFVVNVVSEELAERMNFTSADFPPHESEFVAAGLTALPSDLVRAPRCGEAPAALECRLFQVIELGREPSYVVIGEVVRIHIDERVWQNGRIDESIMRPLGRLAGSEYSYTRDLFRMPRPAYADLLTAKDVSGD